ncbi:NitT/TauT family transport system ATP-binding protein [Bradyrhizobium sp. USDA 4524]|uniref:ABC transporter ATP-binding protein n=1 Tax=unclassified Bradyrhizobium TaxID=2631580 RepID=UPI00209F67C2|nr:MULTISPECIES: ABC transporter ATP-binding protein [unclassified Bradyrhizobium]MCP1845823.1 NitT/TauT family transport system ATP-binding protein [Bradyrhizobium sp. USDA 4538]MCP1906854.1 NitT/TauT family transport system ATP-binding protein [Bradyrhizobium sp. USDA 4537]MCP1985329.1 NitT/TauT family transport system ATP-binding protein [Bradyrhizobium sp. USDA 4539]
MSGAIELQSVGKIFEPRSASRCSGDTAFVALEDVNLQIKAGEFFVIVGPSGCGKSTLLDLLSGLTLPTSGRILIGGAPVTGPALDRGVVFQQYALFPWRTALKNVEFGLEAKGIAQRKRADIAMRFLAMVGLAEFAERYPHELSGGMKQRVAIARSLAYDPDVLLMDEPFAALDAQTRETLQGELVRIWEESGKTIVFITHGIDEAIYLGQRVAVMTSRPGRIKKVIDTSLQSRSCENDVRGTPEFARLRQEIWTLLRDEVHQAEVSERFRLSASSAPA